MAITQIKRSNIAANAVDGTKIADGTVLEADVATDAITNVKVKSNAAITTSKFSGAVTSITNHGLGSVATLTAGTAAGNVVVLDGSGNLPAISGANLTGIVTDVTSIRQDILTLALHSAILDNRVSYNLPFAFIDQFEDDSGILTETTVDRNSGGEYVSSNLITAGWETIYDFDHLNASATNVQWGNYIVRTLVPAVAFTKDFTKLRFSTAQQTAGPLQFYATWMGTRASSGDLWDYDGTQVRITWVDAGGGNSSPLWSTPGAVTIRGPSDAITYSHDKTKDLIFGTDILGSNGAGRGYNTLSGATVWWKVGPNLSGAYEAHITDVSSYDPNASGGGRMDFVALLEGYISTGTFNATGTLISNVQTAPVATTSLSGVVLYTDTSGTATLGTDLKIYMSANNGTNFTEASSYGTAQTFSGSVKMVRLGKTTVTSGTQVKLKAVWANQVSGSKETRLNGWAINY